MKNNKWNVKLILQMLFLITSTINAQISERDKSRLLEDKIIVDPVENENKLPGVQATFLLAGSRSEIWAMLNDYDNYKKIYGGIDSLKVLENNSSGAKIEFWSDAVIKKIHFVLYRKYDNYEYKLSWHQESGDIEIIEGGWEIMDSTIPEKKILIYRSFIKPKSVIPISLIRRGAMSKAHSMCKSIRDWLEENRVLYEN